MNTPPRFSHSRQGSAEGSSAGPPSSSTGLHHTYMSNHPASGSHTPPIHQSLSPYGHALASLAFQSPSFSSLRQGGQASWSLAHPSSLANGAVHTNQGLKSRSTSENRNDDAEEAYSSEEEEDDDEDDDDEDEVEDGGQDSDANAAKGSGSKRKRSASKDGHSKSGSPSKGGEVQSATDASPSSHVPAKKPKPTRGAKACTNCRRLKMRCVGAEKGPPCNRCVHGNHECIFEQSNRGKKSGKNQKTEAMQQSLKKMEQTLATVLRSIRDPGLAAQQGGMVTRSPSPSHAEDQDPYRRDRRHDPRATSTHGFNRDFGHRSPWPRSDPMEQLPAVSPGLARPVSVDPARDGPSPGVSTVNPAAFHQPHQISASSYNGGNTSSGATHGARFLDPHPSMSRTMGPPSFEMRSTRSHDRPRPSRSSPKLHSLPDNTLNPLGLLAEASLHNTNRIRRHGRASSTASSAKTRDSGSAQSPPKGSKGEGEGGGAGANGEKDGAAAAKEDESENAEPEPQPRLGLASDSYFKPGPMTILPLRRIIIEREMPPELLTLGIVTSEEVLDLFRIFFHHCSQHMLLLDADWHTPTFICSRSPFLFTCICTVASKFYQPRPDLHAKCMNIVKTLAFTVMSRGFKSIEIVQGFLLLSMWNQPAERFEEDKTWLYSGIAIRIATDLNLHRKSVASFSGNPSPDDPAVLDREREVLNKERTWYVCYIVDRNISAQMGKPYSVREDWIVRNCRNWGSRFSRCWDIGISALVDLHRIQSRQLDFLYSSTTSVSGLNTEIDYSLILPVFNEQLEEWKELWRWRGLFDLPPSAQVYLSKQRERQRRARERRAEAKRNDTEASHDDAEAGSVANANDEGLSKTNGRSKDSDKSKGKDKGKRVKEEPKPDGDPETWAKGEKQEDELDHNTRVMVYVIKQAPMRFNHAVLLLNSFGLQQCLDHDKDGGVDKAQYFAKCYEAAKTVVITARDDLREELTYALESQFIALTYACVFLLKLTRPEFQNYVDEDSLVSLVEDAVELLEKVAVNETHSPALYASFLKALLHARTDYTTGSKSGPGSVAHSRAASPFQDAQHSSGMTVEAALGAAADRAANGSGGRDNRAGMETHQLTDVSMDPSMPSDPPLVSTSASTPWDSLHMAAAGVVGPAAGVTAGMEDFWGSLLPPGFAQPPAHETFDTTGNSVDLGSSQAHGEAAPQSRFGMGGGAFFDFGSGAIANGNGGVPSGLNTPQVARSGANTPRGTGSRRNSLFNNLAHVHFDFGS